MEEKYSVVRYFDTYPDVVQARNLNYQSVKKIAGELKKCNKKLYVTYEILKELCQETKK